MAAPDVTSRFSAPLDIAADSTPEQGSDLSESAVRGKPCCQVESHFCSQTDHLTPPKSISAIASQALTVLLSRPWGACLAPERVRKPERGSVPGPRGKACCQEPSLYQVRDAGMQRFPEFSSDPRSFSEVVDLCSVTATVRPQTIPTLRAAEALPL